MLLSTIVIVWYRTVGEWDSGIVGQQGSRAAG